MYRAGSPQSFIRKDVDTTDTAVFMVTWRSVGLSVAPNWFLCTDAANDDTVIIFYPCGVPSKNFCDTCVCEEFVPSFPVDRLIGHSIFGDPLGRV